MPDTHETIVVVGGAGGIGSATVRKYASLKKHVIIGDINEDAAKSLLNELGQGVDFFPVDMLDYDSIIEFTNTIKDSFGTVSHLISLAGGALPEESINIGIEGTGAECLSKSIDLNLKSHIYIIKESLPLIRKDQSPNRSITLISSISALKGVGQPAYSAAKAGLLGLVNGTIGELGKYNIRINAVLPGSVLTERCEGIIKEHIESIKKYSALGRLTTPDEIANTIYAVTHLMTSMTGQYVIADCGQSKTYQFLVNSG